MKKRIKRPSRLDALATFVAQGYTDQHTATINSRRRILEFEGSEVDRGIAALTSALVSRRNRRREIDAELRGLADVVSRR